MERVKMRFGWLKVVGTVLIFLGFITFCLSILIIIFWVALKNNNLGIVGIQMFIGGLANIISGGILECLAFIEDNTRTTSLSLAKILNSNQAVQSTATSNSDESTN